MSKKKNLLIILLILLLSSFSYSQDFFTEGNIKYKKSVQLVNDKLYFARIGTFVIGVLTDQSHYAEIGRINYDSPVVGIKIVEDLAFISLGKNGFSIVNIKSKNNPVELSRVKSVRAFDIDVARGFAYIAGGVEGLSIYDIKDPSKPRKEGFLVQWSDIYRVFVQGRFVYASSPDDGIHIIDVFDPIDPVQISKIDTGMETSVVKIEGDNAYIAAHDQGLLIYDISAPKEPKKIGSLALENKAVDIDILGRTAYVVDADKSLTVINIRDAENPEIIEKFETSEQAGGFSVRYGHAYFSDSKTGIKIISLRKPAAPEPAAVDEKIQKEETPDVITEIADKVKEEVPVESMSNLKTAFVRKHKYAVVVGVSNYQDYGIPDLDYAHKDAFDFYEFILSAKGGKFRKENVKLLIDENATSQNLRDALFGFLKRAKKDDIVYIYFSGHGAPEAENPNNMYLITYDTDIMKLSSTAFPMWDIQTTLARHILAENVIIITDACHSGGVGDEMESSKLTNQNMVNRYIMELSKSNIGRVSLTASESGEVSRESDKWGGGHGVFTYFLLKGLDGKADKNSDDVVSLGELINYTFKEVIKETKSSQHPDVSGKFNEHLPVALLKK